MFSSDQILCGVPTQSKFIGFRGLSFDIRVIGIWSDLMHEVRMMHLTLMYSKLQNAV